MRHKSFFMVLLPILYLAGCGDPRDKELPLDLSTATDAKTTFVALTPAEQQAVSRYEIRRSTLLAQGDESARKSVTYRQAIAEEAMAEAAAGQRIAAAQVKLQAAQSDSDAKAAMVKAQAEADARTLGQSIACELKSKSIKPEPKPDMPTFPLPIATYDLACHNTSGAKLNAFKGKVNLESSLGELIAVIPIRRDEALDASGTFDLKVNEAFVTMGSSPDALAFRDMPTEKIKVKVQLDSLFLFDGRLVGAGAF